MRIAHISDLHLSSMHRKKRNYLKVKKIIELALENGAQHFVFTGDISDNSDEKDFKLFRNLLIKYNLLSSEKSSIVIGNHDIFGGPQTAQEVLSFPKKCMEMDYNQKIISFINHFRELFENTIRMHDELFFPYVKEIKNFLIVGFNSIDQYSRLKNPFASNGHIPKDHRKFVKMILSKGNFKNKTKIVLVHHHFYPKNISSHSSENTLWNRIENYTMKLRGKKKLLKLFTEKEVKIVFHGHSHEVREYSRENMAFVNAGGSIDNDKPTAELILADVTYMHTSIKIIEVDFQRISAKKESEVPLLVA